MCYIVSASVWGLSCVKWYQRVRGVYHVLCGVSECVGSIMCYVVSESVWGLSCVMWCQWVCGVCHPIKNLRRVLGVSLENYFSPVRHAWHLLPWFFHGQLTDFPLENNSTLCVVVCGHRWFTVIHYWNIDNYRRVATGEFPESMEVYPDKTP